MQAGQGLLVGKAQEGEEGQGCRIGSFKQGGLLLLLALCHSIDRPLPHPPPKLKRPLGLHLFVWGGNPAKGPVCGPSVPLDGCRTDCVAKK